MEDNTPTDRAAGTPIFNLDIYRPRVRDRFVTDAEADAFLKAIGQVMIMMVDAGLSVKHCSTMLPFLDDFSPDDDTDVQ